MRFNVQVSFTKRYTKDLTVYASDSSEAEEKAQDIVLGWDDVEDVDIVDIEDF